MLADLPQRQLEGWLWYLSDEKTGSRLQSPEAFFEGLERQYGGNGSRG